jgi:hypothetical protein
MAYSTSNPPNKLVAGTLDGSGGPAIWSYVSADAIATVKAADYFSNGSALGMKVGDFILVYDNNTPTVSSGWIKTVTAGGAASMSGSVTTLSSS